MAKNKFGFFFILFCSIILFMQSCGGDTKNQKKPANNWTDADSVTYMDKCKLTSKDFTDTINSVKYCNCMLEKMKQKYPDVNKLKKMSDNKVIEESLKLLPGCFK